MRIFDLKATELVQETVPNLKRVMNHVVTYFGPKECLSKQKRYMRYKMIKPRRLTTRQYVGLVRDLVSRMTQLPPLFKDSQMLDEFELLNSLTSKAPRSHKAMLIDQGFNPETATLETFVNHCERTETTDDIAGAKFAASARKGSLGGKSAPRLRMIMVRNASSVPPRCIDLSMETIPLTTQRSVML